jgi:uncharacterized protein YndB with AHSA1/START domain
MDMENKKAASTADREITVSRVFDAPRELVWEAWTDPRHVVHWWGPNGFTTTIEKMDVRPGGVWKHVMHGPDGTDYPNKSTFTEVVKPERICFLHGGSRKGDPGVQFEATWTFEALGDKTRLTVHMVFPTAADRERVVRDYGALEGAHQTLARLAGHLQQTLSGQASVTITRLLNAPRELVWQAWTDPVQLAQWWGPHGFTAPLCELDLRPGGTILIHMRGPAGSPFDMIMPMKGMFREIVAPERLVFVSSAFHDETGNPQLEVLNTLTLEERQGKTRLTLNAVVIKSTPATAGAIAGMKEGWAQSIEKLAAQVEK